MYNRDVFPCNVQCLVTVSVLRGNALIQSLIAGPLVFINDPSRARPKVIEPLKVAQDIMQVSHISRDR